MSASEKLSLAEFTAWRVGTRREHRDILTPTDFCNSKFRALPLCMTLLLILLMALTFMFVLVPVELVILMLLLLLFIWFEIVQMFSFGLSLPTETGRGLSEHGEASRETDSESSSLNGFPVRASSNRIKCRSTLGFCTHLYWCRPSYPRGPIPSIY